MNAARRLNDDAPSTGVSDRTVAFGTAVGRVTFVASASRLRIGMAGAESWPDSARRASSSSCIVRTFGFGEPLSVLASDAGLAGAGVSWSTSAE